MVKVKKLFFSSNLNLLPMAIPTNEEIYDKAVKESSHHMTQKQIALNAMFDLRKLLEKKKKTK